MDRKSKKILGLISIISIILLFYIFSPNLPTRSSIIETITPSPTSKPKFEVTIPSKGLLKNYVTASVKAETGTICNLIFIPASGETLDMNTIADENGDCIWRWKLEESYKKGTARLIFTINGISDTHFLQILENF
ncbi:MAG: hypothetical protein KF758_13620 [Anaerolineales bacterium]|nr:hypothetical protein [Anaerolineales bacterium]